MPEAQIRGDALRIETSGDELPSRHTLGTIDGVTITAASGVNPIGTGLLRSVGIAGDRLQWRAPGSETFGPEMLVAGDGSYLVEDGDNRDAWIRAKVSAAHLHSGAMESLVELGEVTNSTLLSIGNLSNANRITGGNTDVTLTLHNVGNTAISGLIVWAGPESYSTPPSGGDIALTLSDDDITYVNRFTEAAPLSLADIPGGGTSLLYVRRTFAANSGSEIRLFCDLHFRYDAL